MSRRLCLCLTAAAVAIAAVECRAIEMYTFFGDGSRIGLPSLEVPVEAYPGIPLRSDRLRARRRAARPAAVRGGAALPGTITLRAAPTAAPAIPVPPDPPAPVTR
ncbi:MAG: hypothetical protein ACKOZU_07355 [Planctomycetaceae bacterium]